MKRHIKEIIYIEKYFNTKYTEDRFVNIIKNHERNQSNMNSTIKIKANTIEGLNHSNENSNTKRMPFKTKTQNKENP